MKLEKNRPQQRLVKAISHATQTELNKLTEEYEIFCSTGLGNTSDLINKLERLNVLINLGIELDLYNHLESGKTRLS